MEDFDASRLYDAEPLSFEEQNQHSFMVHKISAGGVRAIDAELSNTRRAINEAHARCNRLTWGHTAINPRAPRTAAEVKHAIDEAGKHGDRLQRAAREAQSLRYYAKLLAEALEVASESASDEMYERADAERETELRAQFEASEKASRERRYQEWRAAR